MLQHLPAETATLILASLPDIKTLLNFIAASPRMLHIYCYNRERVFISVARNQIGSGLLRHATFLDQEPNPPHTLEDFEPGRGYQDIDIVGIKSLLRQERRTCSIIQTCIDDELGKKVELADIEWLRLRRGMYNLRVAARLSELDDDNGVLYTEANIGPYCRQLAAHEILEMLYILHCLRNRFAKYLLSLGEALFIDVTLHAFRADFEHDLTLFTEAYREDRLLWNYYAPFNSNLEDMTDLCKVPAKWTRDWNYDPRFTDEDFQPIDVIDSMIPRYHDFSSSEGEGFRWLERYSSGEILYDYHHAIPLGFMIWEESRLKTMSWALEAPPLQQSYESWLSTHPLKGESVEARFDKAWLFAGSGERLNTWMDHEIPGWKMRNR